MKEIKRNKCQNKGKYTDETNKTLKGKECFGFGGKQRFLSKTNANDNRILLTKITLENQRETTISLLCLISFLKLDDKLKMSEVVIKVIEFD